MSDYRQGYIEKINSFNKKNVEYCYEGYGLSLKNSKHILRLFRDKDSIISRWEKRKSERLAKQQKIDLSSKIEINSESKKRERL